ncbi:cysteine--1-D-myo-inosityl 2-amino-2-deoxy-alpha-D-glucopyranoside ligase [Haloglycomyces albus]|uniref:cysteine--1-D-myo-inosityl 2-amino-2-deoxy-alpha-D-glucopyranoside ligase n=1 Tax=Haloglycomyces albus TaxID=526067 RepID=UPI00046D238F|nr:cysteine--1-D-myo-inosityl 2-amino-2-deoxy-alpha-D-glucopyranoside ligase [Haloglycomyces albus]
MDSWNAPEIASLPGKGEPLRLFDTSSQEVINPLRPEATEATLYVCGITPYDATHLGHAATMITFDLVARYWRDQGIRVRYAQNVTDVDEPLFERAERDGEDWRVLGLRETALYREDMAALGIVPPDHFVGAIETIPEIGEAVARLLETGHAYRHESGDVYYSVDSEADFGAESNYDHSTMVKFFGERGGDPDREGKRNILDPILWNAPKEGEPQWESPVGPGRPGWHIECSLIAMGYLSDSIDLQGGGTDLIFPHHEMSASHAQSLSGERPFARAYVHTGMIGLDGEKMSKSLGNLVFVSRLRADGVDPNAVRLGLLTGHYRSDRQWSDQVLAEAKQRLARWSAAVRRDTALPAGEMLCRVRQHLADDLDTPRALAAVDAWVEEVERDGGTDPSAPILARDTIAALLGIEL